MSFPEIRLCHNPENWNFGKNSGWVFKASPIRVKFISEWIMSWLAAKCSIRMFSDLSRSIRTRDWPTSRSVQISSIHLEQYYCIRGSFLMRSRIYTWPNYQNITKLSADQIHPDTLIYLACHQDVTNNVTKPVTNSVTSSLSWRTLLTKYTSCSH